MHIFYSYFIICNINVYCKDWLFTIWSNITFKIKIQLLKFQINYWIFYGSILLNSLDFLVISNDLQFLYSIQCSNLLNSNKLLYSNVTKIQTQSQSIVGYFIESDSRTHLIRQVTAILFTYILNIRHFTGKNRKSSQNLQKLYITLQIF